MKTNIILKTKHYLSTLIIVVGTIANLYCQSVDPITGSISYTVAGTYTYTVPACVYQIDVEVFGAGGGGGGDGSYGNNNYAGGGGGGGAYSKSLIDVVPGEVYTFYVGMGGAGGTGGNNVPAFDGEDGEDSWFQDATNTNVVLAKGGSGGAQAGDFMSHGGEGGLSTLGIGDITWAGGDGGNGTVRNGGNIGNNDTPNYNAYMLGGGGGGSGGRSSDGNDGKESWDGGYQIGPAGGASSGGGVNGGQGGSGAQQRGDGKNGSEGGGGGGGGVSHAAPATGKGGDGGTGRVNINPGKYVTFNTTNTWVAPPGVFSVEVEVWGAGGGGGGGCQAKGSDSYGGGGGGGGGAYSKSILAVTPGVTYAVNVGVGGTAGQNGTNANCDGNTPGGDGGDSWFESPTTIFAEGGKGGEASNRNLDPIALGGIGGSALNGIGGVKYSGGNGLGGSKHNFGTGGGGGSSAGRTQDGNDGWDDGDFQTGNANSTPGRGGLAPIGGSAGADGGKDWGVAWDASDFGGGGGGGAEESPGGAGANGQITIGYKEAIVIENNATPSDIYCAAANDKVIHSTVITGSSEYHPTCRPNTITDFSFVSSGNYLTSEIDNFKLYYTTTNTFATTNLVATISNPSTAGVQTFSGINLHLGNNKYYFWVTADVNTSLGGGRTITVDATRPADIVSYPTPTSILGAPEPASGTHTFNSLPSATVAVAPLVCKDATEDVTFTAVSGSAPYTFTYNIDGNANTTITAAGTTTVIPHATGTPGITTYNLVSIIDSLGCTQPLSSTAQINVLPPLTGTVTSSVKNICEGQASTFNFTGSLGTPPYTFSYSIDSLNAGSQSTGSIMASGTSTILTSPNAYSDTLVVTLTGISDASGIPCPTAVNSFDTLIIDAIPSSIIRASIPDVCAGVGGTQDIVFDASANPTLPTPITFNYYTRTDGGAQVAGTTTSEPGQLMDTISFNIPLTASQTIFYNQSVSSSTCGGGIGGGSDTINVNPLPTATIGGTTTVCKYATSPEVTFTGTGSSAPYTFSYSINGGTAQTVISDGTGVASVAAPTDPDGVLTYSLLSVQDGSNTSCTNTASGSAIITINPAPSATITGGLDICKNGPSPNITFKGSLGTPPYDFTYNINGGASQIVSTTGTASTVTIAAPTTNAGIEQYNLTRVQDANASTCGFANDFTTVRVNEMPTATISGTAEVCRNATSPIVTFTGANGVAPYTFTYTINGGPNQTIISDGTGIATVAAPTDPAGVFTYDLVSVQDASSTNCLNTVASNAVITINPAPGASIIGDAVNCKNTVSPEIVLTGLLGDAPYTFTYNINGGANQTVSSAGAEATVSIAAPTNIVGNFRYNLVAVQDANLTSCGFVNDNIEVVINELPRADVTSTSTICETDNGTITFTGAEGVAPYTFSYNLNGGASQIITTTNGNSVTLTKSDIPGSYTYTLEDVTDGNTCSQVQTNAATLEIDPLPSASAGGTHTVCENATATINGASLTNGKPVWTHNGNGSISSGINTLNPTYTANSLDKENVVTLTLTVTSDNTCGSAIATATETVVVDPLPTAVAGNNATICENASATISGASTTNGTILWTSNGSGTLSNETTTTPIYTAAAGDAGNAVTLTMTVTSNNSCGTQTAIETTTVNVDSLPTATAGGVQTICQNARTTISGANYTNGTPMWTITSGNGSLSNVNTLAPSYAAAIADAGNTVLLTMTVTSNNACNGATATANETIIVNALPTALANGSQTICEGDAASLIDGDAAATNGTIAWTENGSGSITSGANSLTPTYTSAVGDAGNTVVLTMTVTSNNTCGATATANATYSVPVRQGLNGTTALSTSTVCKNSTAQVIFTGTNGTPPYTITYKVDNGANQVATTIGSNDKLVIGALTNLEGNNTYEIVNVADAYCSQAVSSIKTMTVLPLPTASITGGESICQDSIAQNIILHAGNGTGPYTFNYTIDGNSNSTTTVAGVDSSAVKVNSSFAGTLVYTLQSVSDANNCTNQLSSKATIIIEENPIASFELGANKATIIEPTVDIYENSLSATSWSWNFGDGTTSNSSDPQYHEYKDTGSYAMVLVVENGLGCADSITRTVVITSPILVYIPEAFTPNDDGINDSFLPKGEGIGKFSMKIYDRWGNLIFISDDINQGWDGIVDGGSELAQIDSYVYVVEVEDLERKTYTYRGVLQLVR